MKHSGYKEKILPEWRKNLLKKHLILVLILFELVLSIIFIVIGYLRDSYYFRGVGIGLVIAYVTSAIAYLFKKMVEK